MQRRAWLAAAGWALLLLAGHAATLALVRAGPRVGYQHLLPWPAWPAAPPWALAALGVELAAVALALWRRRAGLRALVGTLSGSRLAAALAVGGFLASAAALSRDPGEYVAELLAAAALQALHLAAAAMFALRLPLPAATPRAAPAAATSLGVERWVIGLALTVVAASAALAVFAYQRHPHLPDEVAYLLQARTFATGRLALPAPAVPEAFEVYLMWTRDGRWFSVFPPAWPALLAAGVLLGAPFLVNPLLAGLNVVLVRRLLGKIYPAATARLATALFAASPWNLFLAMSLMSHTSALTVALLAALAVARLRARGGLASAAAAGTGAGLLTLFRPLEGVVLALLLAPWICVAARAGRRWAAAALFAAGAAAAASLSFCYNRALLGTPWEFPVMAYMNRTFGAGSNALGFGADRGAGWTGLDPLPGHGPLDVVVNAALNSFQINVDLFGWPAGSLVALCLAATLLRWRPADRALAAAALTVAAVHGLYWFSGGPDFGARYWYLAVVPIVALSARGIEALAARAEAAATGDGRRVRAAVLLLSVSALALFVPWRAIDKYRHYRGMRPELREAARREPWRAALVLIRGAAHPDYASAAIYNPLLPAADEPLFAWDRGRASRARLIAALPRRSYWLVDGPSLTGAGYRVVAGPLDAEALLAAPEPPLR